VCDSFPFEIKQVQQNFSPFSAIVYFVEGGNEESSMNTGTGKNQAAIFGFCCLIKGASVDK